MKYNIKAKAIEYDGIVFRSKLEARCYQYLKYGYSSLDGYEIKYEPKTRIDLWTPDLVVYKNGSIDILIEVKPVSLGFDVVKYILSVLSRPELHECHIVCMDQKNSIYFNSDGGFTVYPHYDQIWKQTFNDINHG